MPLDLTGINNHSFEFRLESGLVCREAGRVVLSNVSIPIQAQCVHP